MLYVTPGKFRTSGTGVDLTGITDIELASVLDAAGDMANEYCSAPWGHDFRGGTVVDEIGTWDMGGSMIPGNRQVYPLHRPLKTVTDLRIEVTGSQHVAFDTDELYLAHDRAEVVSMAMTSYGLFGAAIIPNIGLQKPQYRISYTYGESIPVVNEKLFLSDARTFRAQNQWWDEEVDPVVRIDGVEATTGFTIDYDEGTVLLDTVTATTTVHVDYSHRLHSSIAKAVNIIAVNELGERNLTRKGLNGLIELAVGPVRLRRDFPRAGVRLQSIPDRAQQLLDTFRVISIRGT
jgi:hypothetical protein